jgi:hypothetical protein
VLDSVFAFSRKRVPDGVLDLCLPYAIGEDGIEQHALGLVLISTEGSLYTHGDPSVIRQDRAVTPMRASRNATSLNEAGEAKTESSRTRPGQRS